MASVVESVLKCEMNPQGDNARQHSIAGKQSGKLQEFGGFVRAAGFSGVVCVNKRLFGVSYLMWHNVIKRHFVQQRGPEMLEPVEWRGGFGTISPR